MQGSYKKIFINIIMPLEAVVVVVALSRTVLILEHMLGFPCAFLE